MLGLFAGVVVVRAIIVARRNIVLAQIEMGFIETVRARLARRLVAATLVIIGAQIVIAFLLSPLLTIVALMLRRA